MASDPGGLLIIRARIEEGSSEPLRAQVRLSADVSTERTLTLARPEAVCALVQEWLADILTDADRPEPPGSRIPSRHARVTLG